jgi:hypothetical protein
MPARGAPGREDISMIGHQWLPAEETITTARPEMMEFRGEQGMPYATICDLDFRMADGEPEAAEALQAAMSAGPAGRAAAREQQLGAVAGARAETASPRQPGFPGATSMSGGRPGSPGQIAALQPLAGRGQLGRDDLGARRQPILDSI